MATRIAICNRALVRIGEAPLQSEVSDEAEAVLPLYDSAVEVGLGLGAMSFAMALRRLARDAIKPAGRWLYRFQLPAESLEGPRALYDSETATQPFTRWELMDDGIYTDAEEIWARVRVTPSPQLWSPLFTEGVVVYLASMLAGSMKENSDLAQTLYVQAMGDPRVPGDMGLFARARALDAASQPSGRLMTTTASPLIAARY